MSSRTSPVKPPVEASLNAAYAPLPDLSAVSSIVSLHLPLTPKTRRVIGGAQLLAMPVGPYLVNTSRGGLVDEAALQAAIERGHVAGAALDVLERVSRAEQDAAMYQERARNLEEETKHLRAHLALPPPQPDPVEELRAKVDELT